MCHATALGLSHENPSPLHSAPWRASAQPAAQPLDKTLNTPQLLFFYIAADQVPTLSLSAIELGYICSFCVICVIHCYIQDNRDKKTLDLGKMEARNVFLGLRKCIFHVDSCENYG